MKVLLIAGASRSGSTILDNILNEIPGVTSVGELRYVWDRGFTENRLCGCGVAFRECEFWRSVLEGAYRDEPAFDAKSVISLRDQVRSRDALFAFGRKRRRRMHDQLAPYAAHLLRLYRGTHETTGCSVIVDSSKFPSHGFALNRVPGIDLYILHLVRDARAVSFSWKRRRLYDQSSRRMGVQSPARSAWLWLTWNAVVEFMWGRRKGRYLRIRYEDFMARPAETVSQVMEFVGEPTSDLSFLSPRGAHLTGNHAVSGNPSRFERGAVQLRLDTEWMASMKASDRVVVTLMTWPLLIRHGYIKI